MAVELTGTAVQVHGGMGFIEETGIAQHYRDARITTIYEGTNGIQAMDLVGRKIGLKAGAVVAGLFDEIAAVDVRLAAHPDLAQTRSELSAALAAVRGTTQWIMEHSGNPLDVLSGATPYLRQMSVLVGGYCMAESALIAREATDLPADVVAAKVGTARFFCEQLLPQVHGLSGAVMGDSELLMSFGAESLAV
jgi:alkylation response protein AidB-like acyl-CoA dehydrogenase